MSTVAADEPAPAEIRALLDLACGYAQLRFHAATPWSVAPLTGTRHTVTLEFEGIDAFVYGEAFISSLPNREIALAGKLVVDVAVVTVERAFHLACTTVTLMLLILEDC